MVDSLPIVRIDAAKLAFGTAKKTKPILAKPMNTLLNDERVLSKFLLATLEGSQMLKANSMVCLGTTSDNDVWQQTVEKLHKQYDPVSVDKDGWTTFQPKPENERDVHEVTAVDVDSDNPEEPFILINCQWGDRQSDGTFIQRGTVGDFIIRNQEDHTDVWVVAKRVFLATYNRLT